MGYYLQLCAMLALVGFAALIEVGRYIFDIEHRMAIDRDWNLRQYKQGLISYWIVMPTVLVLLYPN